MEQSKVIGQRRGNEMFSYRLSATFSAMPKVIFMSHLMIEIDSNFQVNSTRNVTGGRE